VAALTYIRARWYADGIMKLAITATIILWGKKNIFVQRVVKFANKN
jgi:hypothetical protein